MITRLHITMKSWTILATILWLSPVRLCQEWEKSYEQYQVIEIGGLKEFRSEDDIFSKLELPLEEDLEIVHQDSSQGTAQVLVRPQLLNQFKKSVQNNSFSYEVIIDNVGALIDTIPKSFKGLPKGESTFQRYMTFEEIQIYLETLRDNYPNKVHLTRIGKSNNLANITMVTISKPSMQSQEQLKPIIFVEAGAHAREWISVSSAVYLIEKLSKSTTSLTSEVEWRIVPVSNPDGYKYSWTGNRLWRKNRRRHYTSQCYGVDLNRNFDSFWKQAGTSKRICSAVYGGKHAFSEPETRAIRDAVLKVKSRVKAYISLHSYGQFIFHPPGGPFTSMPQKTTDILKSISQKMSVSINDDTGMKYKIGSPAKLLYPASGLSMDWALFNVEVPLSFTFELRDKGKNGFLLPIEEIEPAVKDIWIAMKTLHKEVSDLSKKGLFESFALRRDSSLTENGLLITRLYNEIYLNVLNGTVFELADGEVELTNSPQSKSNISALSDEIMVDKNQESISLPEQTTTDNYYINDAAEVLSTTDSSTLEEIQSTTSDEKANFEGTESEGNLTTTEFFTFFD